MSFCQNLSENDIIKNMKPIILIIFDGFGMAPARENNAITKAKTPVLNEIQANFPSTALQASGAAVGLPWGEAGNSEVGHLTIGSGRNIFQHLPRIIFAIRDGSFFKNPAFLGAVKHVKEKKSNLHLVGLIGSGSVHSYIDHLYALLDLAQKENLSQKTYLHLFTDGKDSPPHEAAKFVYNIRQRLESLDVGEISTIMGRFYAMDRDNNWDRTEAAYRLLTEGAGEVLEDPVAALEKAYQENSSDERVKPVVIRRADKAANAISDNDAVIFFNFREDSERQLTKAFVQPRFDKFPRRQLNNLYFVAMTEYEKGLPFEVAFPPIGVENALGEVFSNTQKKQVRIAETEKYAHVTYFFNGGKEIAFPGEDRILIPSITTPHLEQQPAMAAYEITDKLLDALEKKIYDLAVVNYANSDMVGHTGNFDATVKAVEVLDRCLGMIYKWVLANDVILILTSDHGNAEEKFDLLTGETRTEHSTNPVPFYLIAKPYKRTKTSEEIIRSNIEIGGLLADVAPTILELAGLAQPKEMTGKSLLKILI